MEVSISYPCLMGRERNDRNIKKEDENLKDA